MRLLPWIVCCAALHAQDATTPLRFIPADCEIVLRARGPAAWKREFAPTNLGTVFANPDLLPNWKKVVSLLGSEVRENDEVRNGIVELSEMLGAYGGEMVLAVRVDWDAMNFDDDRSAGALILALGPDSTTDLKELGSRIADMLPAAGEGEIAFGDQFASVRRDGAWEIAGPLMCDDCLVLVAGADLENRARPFFEVAEHDRFEPPDDVGTATLGVQILIGRLLAKACEVEGGDGEARRLQIIKDLGLGSIASMSLALFPDGKYVGQTLAVDCDGADRGVVGMVLPMCRTRPTLLRYLPAGAQTWSVAPFDGASLQGFYPRLFESLEDELPFTRDEFEQQFTAYTKLRVVEDVLALIGDEYMRIDDMAAAVEYDEDMSEAAEEVQESFSNTCFVLQLRDGKVFGKNLDTAIRARGLHVGRKSEPYAETKIYRMNLVGMFPIEYAVTDSLFVLGFGDSEGTKQNLRGVLDRVAAGQAEPTAFSSAIKQRLEGLPEDWSGIAVASVTEALDGMLTTLADWEAGLADENLAPEEVEDPWWAVLELAKALRPELARQGAATAVTVDYFGRARYLSRTRW